MYPAQTRNRAIMISFIVWILVTSGESPAESARVITIVNNCRATIWPAVTPGDIFNGGGFSLAPGQTVVFAAPARWVGRIWARTGCEFDRSGNGSCHTGACGTALKCAAASGQTPATLAEFTLGEIDYYDVSLVDGFNLPVVVRTMNGQGNCSPAGCDEDLLRSCPEELQLRAAAGKVVGCRSACDVFDTDEYCCRGVFRNPIACHPTTYSRRFKVACPSAYSYAYDDPTSTFTCSGADYVVSFCSSRRQNVCTYRDSTLVCSGTSRSGRIPRGRRWLQAAMLLSLICWWITA